MPFFKSIFFSRQTEPGASTNLHKKRGENKKNYLCSLILVVYSVVVPYDPGHVEHERRHRRHRRQHLWVVWPPLVGGRTEAAAELGKLLVFFVGEHSWTNQKCAQSGNICFLKKCKLHEEIASWDKLFSERGML